MIASKMRWVTRFASESVRRAITTSASNKQQRGLPSLALSVYFKHPSLGMKEHEILSRATAFLLSIDGKSSVADGGGSSAYAHLSEGERERKERQFRHKHKYSRPDMTDRQMSDLGWLEYVPREARPRVHIVTSSHVLAPFLWRDYYPQEWLKHVSAEHCSYAVEVLDPDRPEAEPLAKVALNSEVFHHPEGRDIALIHFQEESESLTLLESLGVKSLHLRDPDNLFEKKEKMFFDGFVVKEANTADSPQFASSTTMKEQPDNEDTRVFYPYTETGNLSFHTNDRFFATTPAPLPEGLCGAPVLDADGSLCGCVEGIVPVDHKDKRLAGSAAFMPSHVMKVFVDYVERGLVDKMMPADLFRAVVEAKTTNRLNGVRPNVEEDSNVSWDDMYNETLSKLKEKYSAKELSSILDTIEDQRKEVFKILEQEGGDVDEVVERVQKKRLQIRELVLDQYRKTMEQREQGNTKGTNSKPSGSR